MIDTANYKITSDSGGRIVSFYCASSGMLVYTSPPLSAETDEEAVRTAWETEGKSRFDKCHVCGRWVSTVMYNADVLECVDCAPWENAPKYCSGCGAKAEAGDVFCSWCGTRLMYGGNGNED